jgi:hypothetical protein
MKFKKEDWKVTRLSEETFSIRCINPVLDEVYCDCTVWPKENWFIKNFNLPKTLTFLDAGDGAESLYTF